MADVCVCGHPMTHHDAGECWTDPEGREIHDDVPGKCPCGWAEVLAGAVDRLRDDLHPDSQEAIEQRLSDLGGSGG